MVTGRNADTLASARAALPDDVVVIRADSKSMADVERIATEARVRFGTLGVVFINAGIGRLIPLQDVDEATYDEYFGTYVKGPFFIVQKLMPLFEEGSSVIFNGAFGAHRGIANW